MTSVVVALAGCPNSGKSALFNALTGARQKVGNYPGVTVEKKFGIAKTPKGAQVTFIDLPGTYSLKPKSPDEKVALNVLTDSRSAGISPDVVLAVADATNLERTLGLVLELKKTGKPVIAVLNMMDLALKRGIKLDKPQLSKALGVPVVSTIATRKQGIDQLLQRLDWELSQDRSRSTATKFEATDPSKLFAEVDAILEKAIKEPTKADVMTHRLDRILLHPVLGGFILMLTMLAIFQAVFSWAEAPMGWIEGGIELLGAAVTTVVPGGLIQSLLVDGIIAGVGAVLVFLPQILILFFFIFLLEGSGYMTRAAFIMDRFMSMVGLQGRAFVPLLSSFACAIPGIMATRTIKDPKERLTTILVAPLMTCSARLPVYVLLIGAFIPDTVVFGPLTMQGLAMFSLYIFAIISAVIIAFLVKHSLLRGPKSSFILELPTYKLPDMRNVLLSVYMRGKVFIKKAGTLVMTVAIVLWALSTFPQAPADYDQPEINYSVAGRIGQVVEPILQPIGFDWRIATGLIPGFAAREVMVGALATVFSVAESDDEDATISTLGERLRSAWPPATGFALLAWYIFAPQCLATFAVAKRETNGWKWPTVMFVYMLLLAYVAAFATYHFMSWVFS